MEGNDTNSQRTRPPFGDLEHPKFRVNRNVVISSTHGRSVARAAQPAVSPDAEVGSFDVRRSTLDVRGFLTRIVGHVLVVLGLPALAQSLVLAPPTAHEAPRLSLAAASNAVVTLETTADFRTWTPLLVGQGTVFDAPDLRAPRPESAFYRAAIRPRTAADDGKDLLGSLQDSFRSPEPPSWAPASRWIKFAILLDEPHRVRFQDSAKYAYHYDFARVRLPGFTSLTRAEFDAVTLRTNDQRAVLGAVVFPPSENLAEFGIQIVGLDAFPRESIAAWFATVRAMIHAPPGVQAWYLPTFEQADVARANRDWFAAQGIEVSDAGRWVVGDECYAPGWALGRLNYVPGDAIASAYRDGRLRPDDILLTDAVPAEVPPLAGIVSLLPATPNSHVALLARSFGIPFVHLPDPTQAATVRGWTNREVMLRAAEQFLGCDVTIAAIEAPIDPQVRADILALKVPPVLDLPPKLPSGSISIPADGLRPVDIRRVGGKAANFGVLRRAVPTNAPTPALALTFDLWDGFLDQPMPGGGTLRSRIAARLAGFGWPADIAALQTALADVRDWIRDTADFSPSQKAEILALLQGAGFDPLRKIRFRSSTNVEDSEQFSGAGLYDSYSGCLADDLDDDTAGPSRCDPAEPRERGVFRALRRVYASFYNDNAFLERLRHRVDETAVGMAVLVHYSTPDPFEEANGVATLGINKNGGRFIRANLVTQLGAVSVTNPDTTAVPESVSVNSFGGTPDFTVDRRSSLVPLGGTVMRWETDYRQLFTLLNRAAQGYEAEFPSRQQFLLDFEFKKVAPEGRLHLKQIREVPEPPERTHIPWILDATNRIVVFQGEFGDIVANHRLKSVWSLAVRNVRLVETNLASTLLTRIEGEWRDGTNAVAIGGPPSALPNSTYRRSADELSDRWSWGEGPARRDFDLTLARVRETTSREGPLMLLADHRLQLGVTYATPMPTLGYLPASGTFGPTTTRQEFVRLAVQQPITAESLRQERRIQRGNLRVTTVFWWPPPPTGPSAGYTAPLQAWVETTIAGLTSRPIVLRSDWAQTYLPGHHNFFEDFAFEPRLDPDVPSDLLAELAAANVKALILSYDGSGLGTALGYIWGLDDRFRPL